VPATVVPRLKFYKRKPNAPSQLPYLRAFDQGRDRPEDLIGKGKVALFIPDEQVSGQLLGENYNLVREAKDAVTLAAGERKVIDFTVEKDYGDFLIIYDVRDAGGRLIAGGPLPFVVPSRWRSRRATSSSWTRALMCAPICATCRVGIRIVPSPRSSPLPMRPRRSCLRNDGRANRCGANWSSTCRPATHQRESSSFS